MIKINLAKRKYTPTTSSKSTKVSMPKPSRGIDFSQIAPLRKAILHIAAIGIAFFLFEEFKQQEITAKENQLQQIQAEQTVLQAEFNRTRGYEGLKKQLEEDELLIRTKISTIRDLIQGREDSYKFLISLSEATPEMVWLEKFQLFEDRALFRGGAYEIGIVSDLMKNLGESVFLSNVALKTTTQSMSDRGVRTATFELEATRR